jgi:DNA-binding CsgD family transcriptional regulator
MAEDAGPGARAEAAARLAELRVRQGRLDEAAALLAEFDDAASVPIPVAAVCLAQGEAGAAAAILERHRAQLGDRHVELAPTLALLVDAYLTTGDHESAEEAAQQLATVADRSGRPHALALTALAEAGIMAASGRLADAAERTDIALRWFDRLDLPLDEARARLDLARLAAGTNPEIAITDARRALNAFEQLGARRDADHAAAFLRDLGAAGRVGPKNVGILTQREQEVLRLVGRGLTNPEIATRLYISRKTAAHHVSNILAKLGLRNRAEAVAYALRELPS